MFLKAINYWSFPGGLDGTLDASELLRLAKEYKFPAVEIGIGPAGSAFGLDVSESTCKAIVSEAAAMGIRISSAASGNYWSNSLGDADPDVRIRAQDELVEMLKISSWLGVKTLLTIPGAVDVFFMPNRSPQNYEQVWRHASEGIRAVLPVAERCGVRMAIENVWNKFLLSPHEMAEFIDQFDSPFVGAYVDVANMLPYGYPEQWLEILGSRVIGVHFKDFRTSVGTAEGFVDLLEGDVDWPSVMGALRKINYKGAVVAELIPPYKHLPLVRIANASNAMDAILSL